MSGLINVIVIAAVTCTALGTLDMGSIRTAQANPALAQSTGEDLFRGIILGSGPVAKDLPELWKYRQDRPLEANVQSARSTLEAAILIHLRASDPNFFDRFEADVKSGDHMRIELALIEATQGLSRSLLNQSDDPTMMAGRGTVIAVDNLPTYLWMVAPDPYPCGIILICTTSISGSTGANNALGVGEIPLKRDMIVRLISDRFSTH